MALPPAILSRFDLVYVMVDDPDETIDANIAQHIVKVHQKRDDALDPAFTTAELKRYIAYAKTQPNGLVFSSFVLDYFAFVLISY